MNNIIYLVGLVVVVVAVLSFFCFRSTVRRGIFAFQGGFGSIIEKAIGQLHKPQAVGDVKPPLLYFEPRQLVFHRSHAGFFTGLFSPRQTAINLLGYLQ
jgi:hypothetical protein